MQLRAENLGAHLARSLNRLYTVCGDEPLLVQEAVDGIRGAARRAGFTEREVLTAEGGFAWGRLRESARSLSLFASLRLIELRIPSGKPGAEGGRLLVAHCAQAFADTMTLVVLPRLDRATQAQPWAQALMETGVWVQVQPVERARLPAWIEGRLAAQGQKAGRDALEFLADQVEGHLAAADQELKKLALLYPPRALSFDEVREAVVDVARFDAFKLAEAVATGDAGRFARMLAVLKDDAGAAPLVLWVLAQEARLYYKLARARREGQSLEGVLKRARVWDSRAGAVRQAAARLSPAAMHAALCHAARIDLMIKGLRPGEVWDELLALGIALARGVASVPGRALAS
ncbi:MAG: DNA polymerase III subunit delta [Betaproteobacteria bacterium]|nr:DNA polymerase III subunit delta [Betaproteobacteria bacterium]